jgi:hypothetical protein
MTKRREKRLSTLGMLVAKSIIANDLPYQIKEISFDEMKQLESRFDFSVFVKAYMHHLLACRDYDNTLSLKGAMAIICLAGIPNGKRSRESVLELLDMLKIENLDKWLTEYEQIHDAYWVSEVNDEA